MGDQGSNKTGSARDDELKHEMQGELNASRALRPEEAFEPIPSGDAGPVTDWSPAGPGGGVPPGMTPRDVDVRSELARHLEPGSFPANRGGLLQALETGTRRATASSTSFAVCPTTRSTGMCRTSCEPSATAWKPTGSEPPTGSESRAGARPAVARGPGGKSPAAQSNTETRVRWCCGVSISSSSATARSAYDRCAAPASGTVSPPMR